MTEAKRQKYTKEFKQDAVRLATEPGYTIAKAARNLGINDNLIGRWKREADAQGAVAFPGQGRQTPEQEELKRLREENRQLKLEREILKKATVFFASQKP